MSSGLGRRLRPLITTWPGKSRLFSAFAKATVVSVAFHWSRAIIVYRIFVKSSHHFLLVLGQDRVGFSWDFCFLCSLAFPCCQLLQRPVQDTQGKQQIQGTDCCAIPGVLRSLDNVAFSPHFSAARCAWFIYNTPKF